MFDMFKKKEKTEEDKEYDKISAEAKQQAMKELKPELVKMYKEQELEKMKKKSKNWGEVLSKEFTEVGNTVFAKDKMDSVINSNTKNTGSMFSDDKIDRMLDKGSSRNKSSSRNDDDNGNIFTQDKINKMLERPQKDKKDYFDI
jgi:hypothetical protein